MNTNPNNTFLAVFLGNKASPRMVAWNALPEKEQKAKMQEGLAAWHAWVEKHKASIVGMGGPLGKTKQITPEGIKDITNNLSGYMVLRADSHETAAKMLENHPHFTVFSGEAAEVMPVLPVPTA